MDNNMMRVAALTIGLLTAGTVTAAPQYLVTHNTTSVESNAYVAGYIPSPYPTKANSDGKVLWSLVGIACIGHTSDGHCSALVKMETNTNHPVEVGTLTLNLETGAITPSHMSANGYSIDVNGPGEVTLSKN